MESSLSSARPENVAKTDMHPLGGRFGGVETGVGKLIFEGFKKRPKRESKSERIVLLGGSKRQKRAGIRSNCPFGGFKKTKESCNLSELSFWRSQKDKIAPDQEKTVFLESSKRQKRAGPVSNCPFEDFKKTKESQTRGNLSFWRA